MAEQQFTTIKLTHKITIATDVIELRFERPTNFVFKAGQFVQFRVFEGATSILRSYSISSTPAAPYLEFFVKIVPDGKASQFFAKLNVGEMAEIGMPKGVFVVSESDRPKIFVVTGTGLAP